MITAGIIGFKKDNIEIKKVLSYLYQAGVSGMCLGFSTKDQWKNKGKNKNDFVRNCSIFRHDTTLLTLFVIKYLNQPLIESVDLFKGEISGNPDQLIWNLRLNYSQLKYLDTSKMSLASKMFFFTFIAAKKIKKWIKLKK